ncbi:MAG: hydroxymethylglutaryl-CoA lyase [Bacteroidia bacterium]
MKVKLIECPRDAMQGIINFIDTDTKVNYLNALLQVGFDTLDCGSFVNPSIIPQMADTPEVLKRLKMTETKLSAIVANVRGAQSAVQFDELTYLGFPFSISETFQKRNTNKTIEQSLETVETILELCDKRKKKFIAYLSMGFGNPYNEAWNPEIVTHWIKKLKQSGANYFSLSDTVGVSNPETITGVISKVTAEFPGLNFGCHFHTRPDEWEEKIEAAYKAGCYRFDGALKGFGGCPMANDKLVGNMPTENMVQYFENKNVKLGLNNEKFNEAMMMAGTVFA